MKIVVHSPLVVLKNFISSILIRTIVPLTSFVIFITVARIMGVELLGKYTLLVTLGMVFQCLCSMGLGPLLVRQIAQRHQTPEALYSSAVVIGLAGLLLWAPLMIVTARMGGYSRDVFISTIVLVFALPFGCLSIINTALFMGLEKFEYVLIVSAAEAVFVFVGSLAVILKGLGIVSLVAVLAGGRLVSALVGLCFAFRRIQPTQIRFDKQLTIKMAKMVPPFFLLYGLQITLNRMDVLLLSFLATEHDLGLYSTALKLYCIIMILPDSYGQTFLPRLSALARETSIRDISLRAIRYAVIGLMPIVLVFFVLGETILVMLFGEAYGVSASALVILIWGLFPALANVILGIILIAEDHQWAAAMIAFGTIVLDAVLNCILIKTMGYQGAALATVIALSACSLAGICYIKRALFNVRILSDFWLLFLPAAAGALVSTLGRWGGWWIRLTVAFLVTALLVWVLRVFKRDDLIWLRENIWLKIKDKNWPETMTASED